MMTKNLKTRNIFQNQLLLVLMFLSGLLPQQLFANDNLEKDSAQTNIFISEGVILYDTGQNIAEISQISETQTIAKKAKKTPKPNPNLATKIKQKSSSAKNPQPAIQNLSDHIKSDTESEKTLTSIRTSTSVFTVSANHYQLKAFAQHYQPVLESVSMDTIKSNLLSTITIQISTLTSETDFARPPPFYFL